MTILPDGRWLLDYGEITIKIWEKIKGWRLENPSNPTHMIPNFPECSYRELKATCKPCGKISAINYWCNKKQSFVSPSYCKGCVELGENL